MGLVWVQGDRDPDITATIRDQADPMAPVNLTGGTVRFQMRKHDDRRYTVNAPATVVDAPLGKVSYAWGPNDLGVPGDYDVQWEVTWPDSKPQTTATPVVITVRRQ